MRFKSGSSGRWPNSRRLAGNADQVNPFRVHVVLKVSGGLRACLGMELVKLGMFRILRNPCWFLCGVSARVLAPCVSAMYDCVKLLVVKLKFLGRRPATSMPNRRPRNPKP